LFGGVDPVERTAVFIDYQNIHLAAHEHTTKYV
jgi:hypothetical protein